MRHEVMGFWDDSGMVILEAYYLLTFDYKYC